MSFDDSAPNGSESGVVCCVLGLVDIGYSLAEVESAVLLVIHSLDLEESEAFMLGAFTSFEAGEDCFGVESRDKELMQFK